MATAPIYCTHKELKRVYPNIDAFDTKTPIYGWELGFTDAYDSTIDIYYANNTGLVTDLFWDGAKLPKLKLVDSDTSNRTTLGGSMDEDAVTMTVGSSTGLATGDIIKVNDEYMIITSIDSGTVIGVTAVARGMFGTTAVKHVIGSGVKLIVDASESIQDASSASDGATFFYDALLDLCVIFVDTKNPADYLIESGENFSSMVTQVRTDASRYLDSKLDPNLPREQLKDKSGNFDYMIIRSTALIAAAFLIRSTDPTNATATALMEEAQGNIDALNDGKAALSWQTTRDASRGIIRDVTYTDGKIRPVDTRGMWNGTFDLVKVQIITGGVLGTATYSVFTKDSDTLKTNQVVTAEKINGDYQNLAGGLQIRFAGETDTTEATANDEWEIEVMGAAEHIDASGVKSVNNSRWL